ncbi:MAG: hypothetical protein IPJ52_09425 [Rhodocyclaceae bacterium]|nr:hypothetical protein [Rhodocyclaceae bacterium]
MHAVVKGGNGNWHMMMSNGTSRDTNIKVEGALTEDKALAIAAKVAFPGTKPADIKAAAKELMGSANQSPKPLAPGWSGREIQAGRTSAGLIGGEGVEQPVSQDIGYNPDNPTQYSYVMTNLNNMPSLKAQAQAWIDGNMLSAQKKIAVKKALGVK